MGLDPEWRHGEQLLSGAVTLRGGLGGWLRRGNRGAQMSMGSRSTRRQNVQDTQGVLE